MKTEAQLRYELEIIARAVGENLQIELVAQRLCRLQGLDPYMPYVYGTAYDAKACCDIEYSEELETAVVTHTDYDPDKLVHVLAPTWIKFLSEAVRINN